MHKNNYIYSLAAVLLFFTNLLKIIPHQLKGWIKLNILLDENRKNLTQVLKIQKLKLKYKFNLKNHYKIKAF